MGRRAHLYRRDGTLNCGNGGGSDQFFNIRVASIFVVLVGSLSGALFPVLAKRTKWLNARVPQGVFDFAKYFGSGVIIATAFIHLLDPALAELGSPCLAPGWSEYPFALAIALLSIFIIFIVEIIAFRWGTAKLAALGISHDPHGHGIGGVAAHGPEGLVSTKIIEKEKDIESGDGSLNGQDHATRHAMGTGEDHVHGPVGVVDSALTKIVGVAILEFGILLHSLLIGMTLAVDPDFKVLFIVIIFHQAFEGLGVGSRLAYLDLPDKYSYVPIIGGILYGIVTPIGIAVGLGIRSSYNPGSTTASIVSGVMDAFSAGILIYTGLVELLAHEFLFNKQMIEGSNGKLAYALTCMVAGCGIMALLGKWA